MQRFAPDGPGEISFLRSNSAEAEEVFSDLPADQYQAWDKLRPDVLLRLGDVCGIFTVRVNGMEASFPEQVCKTCDLTGLPETSYEKAEVSWFPDFRFAVTAYILPYSVLSAFRMSC